MDIVGVPLILLLSASLVSSQLVNSPYPCLSERKACEASQEEEAWKTATLAEGQEKAKCEHTLGFCYADKVGCDKFEGCVPAATTCLQTTAPLVFGRFDAPQCRSYIECTRKASNVMSLCLARFGTSVVAYSDSTPPLKTVCDAAAICKKAQQAGGGCPSLHKRECDNDGDCIWDTGSQRCWDEPDDTEVMELALVCFGAGLIFIVLLCCGAYVVMARPKRTQFSKLDDGDAEMDEVYAVNEGDVLQ